MRLIDTHANARIPVLLELVAAVSRLGEPHEVLDAIISGMRQAYGERVFAMLSTRGLSPGKYRILRLIDRHGADRVEAKMPWDFENLPVRDDGIFSQLVRSPLPKLAADIDTISDELIAGLGSGLHAATAMAAPVFADAAPSEWIIVFQSGDLPFDLSSLEDLIFRSNLVGSAITNLQMSRQLVQANLRAQAEVEQIAAIQRALLPETMPNAPGLSLAASYETFRDAGGDLYDCVSLSAMESRHGGAAGGETETRWALLIGDVSGHGPAAAVVMAMLTMILRAYPGRPDNPGQVLEFANRQLCERPIGSSFVTAWLAFYNPIDHSLQYACAGHPSPLLSSQNGEVRELADAGGLPLGIMDESDYPTAAETLHTGDLLTLYTDGIPEATNADNEFFGIEGLRRALSESNNDPFVLINRVAQLLQHHQNGVEPSDDQTLFAIAVL